MVAKLIRQVFRQCQRLLVFFVTTNTKHKLMLSIDVAYSVRRTQSIKGFINISVVIKRSLVLWTQKLIH